MTFQKIQEIFKSKFGVTKLADIARELGVTPQVVSNWKSRNQLPYKYVKKLNEIIEIKEKSESNNRFKDPITIIQSAGDHESVNESDLDFFLIAKELFFLLKENVLLVTLLPSLISIVMAVYVLYFVSPKFETIIKIIPSQSNQNSIAGFGGISQLGIGAAGADLKSGIYYPDLIMSRALHESILDQEFETKKFGQKRSLISILTGGKKEKSVKESSNKNVSKALKSLKKSIRVKTKRTSMLVEIKVNSFEPKLAYDISNQIINQLNLLLRKFEEDKLKQKMNFIVKRINEEEYDLIHSENELKKFRENNRDINRSPALMLEQERLIRDKQVRTEVYITLKQQYEMAQIKQMDNPNFVHLIDSSGIPIKRKSPERTKSVLLAFSFGMIIAVGTIFFKQRLS